MARTFIDMFAGMGTARMGFEQAGWECVYSIEWDKHKRKIYEVIFGKEPEGKDIRNERGTNLPRSDCWVFGFPCQDVSITGKQLGFNGNRSSLFFEVMRLLHEIKEENRPEWLLAENVKNFLSVNNGWDFLAAQIAMDEAGYDCQWHLLNSKDFGVPQSRERVFLIGHSRRYGRREIFLEREEYEPADRTNRTYGIGVNVSFNKGINNKKTNIANCLQARNYKGIANQQEMTCVAVLTPNRLEKRQNGRRFKNDGEPMFTLTRQDQHGVMIKQVGNLYPDNNRNPEVGRIYDTSGLVPCLNTMQGGNRQPKIIASLQSHAARKTDGICPTITEAMGKGGGQIPMIIEDITMPIRIRRLTPRECMRLQGVCDEITDKLIEAGISDTQMYRAAGDAMTVNVVYEIAKAIGK